MEIDEKINYWVELSDYDLETAEVMLESKRFLYVGFMCHQVIEKILKALYVSTLKSTPPYSHNLTLLTKDVGIFEELSDDQKDFIDLIRPLNVEARYPSYKERINQILNRERCRDILTQTKEFQQWIKQKL
ncbi:MAG TPA: HEPN domain-containing protein [Candidatus Kapabacteria bacterium]|nr:HEPN domain-containing protein [Candidatus Kapabacteria bacterium]